MRRELRHAIETPTGTFRGLWPQSVITPGEGPWIASLAQRLDGAAEVTLPAGRADVLTATLAVEVEPYRTWKHGLHQALSYAMQTGTTPCLALFGSGDYETVYLYLRDRLPVDARLMFAAQPTPTSWRLVTSRLIASRTTADSKRHPSAPRPAGAA